MKYLKILILFCFLAVNVIAQNKTAPIRGTWVTNVASDVLKSKQNIIDAIKLCKKNGLNNIYVVVWNNGVTMYPSKLVESYIGIKQSKIYGNRDPIKEIIEEGHKAGIKVHAWFEFGFAYNYGDSNCLWQIRYPHWVGRDVKGNHLQKNNFFWWNALHPEVQDFMKKLVLEVVENYDVDGVQGDDRLPAMPAEGGYDEYTKKLYASENNEAQPPSNSKDSVWLQWRADKLSAFCKSLYEDVKKAKRNCIVSWAPSIYPWCKEQYLQDWPKWLSGGYADYVIPQLYRYKIEDYEKILKELNAQVPKKYKQKVYPGILSSLGDGYLSTPQLNAQTVALNRKYGFNGEVFFYFETLKRMKENFYKK
jgi:uncharacterized lipoprotein YddW (UPF0748 family)